MKRISETRTNVAQEYSPLMLHRRAVNMLCRYGLELFANDFSELARIYKSVGDRTGAKESWRLSSLAGRELIQLTTTQLSEDPRAMSTAEEIARNAAENSMSHGIADEQAEASTTG
eukprot:tig00000471_g1185.t1